MSEWKDPPALVIIFKITCTLVLLSIRGVKDDAACKTKNNLTRTSGLLEAYSRFFWWLKEEGTTIPHLGDRIQIMRNNLNIHCSIFPKQDAFYKIILLMCFHTTAGNKELAHKKKNHTSIRRKTFVCLTVKRLQSVFFSDHSLYVNVR